MRLHVVASDLDGWRQWQAGDVTAEQHWLVDETLPPQLGDVVIGVLQTPSSAALVMDVSRNSAWSVVERCLLAEDWDDLAFPLRLSTVLKAAGVRTRRPPTHLDGADARAVVRALKRLQLRPASQREGGASVAARRERSRANRAFLIARHSGVCPCCERDLKDELPGGKALAGLQVHHLSRVAAQPAGTRFDTTLDDLAVVCATCHALLSAASPDSTQDLHPDALRQLIRPGSKRRCIRCGHPKVKQVPGGRECTKCGAVFRPQLRPRLARLSAHPAS